MASFSAGILATSDCRGSRRECRECTGQERLHPLLTRRGYAKFVVDCVQKLCSPAQLRGIIDKRKATRSAVSRLNRNAAAGKGKLSTPRLKMLNQEIVMQPHSKVPGSTRMTTEPTVPQPDLGPAPANGQGQSQGHRRRRRRRKNKSNQQGAQPAGPVPAESAPAGSAADAGSASRPQQQGGPPKQGSGDIGRRRSSSSRRAALRSRSRATASLRSTMAGARKSRGDRECLSVRWTTAIAP